MKKRFVLSTILLALIALSLVLFSVTGCSASKKEVTGIRVDEVNIFMGPKQSVEIIGDPSTYKINAAVIPAEAKNKEVYYKFVDARDQQYLDIAPDGTLRARKAKYRKVMDDDLGEEIDVATAIHISVHSRDNPKVSVQMSVIIEEVEVKRIYFSSDMYKIYFDQDKNLIKPQKAEIKFEPAHAVIGRELEFLTTKSSVLSVSKLGFITPHEIGATMVTAIQATGRTKLETHAVFKVIYPSLQYDMRLDSHLSALTRIVGEKDYIEFSLIPLHEKTDPEPDIMWYINDTAINVRGAKDSLKLKYDMSAWPVGEYTIKALLSNNEQTKELVSSVIKIYNPLQNIRVSLLNEITMLNNIGNAVIGDMLSFAVTRKSDEYPAEAYNWTIKTPGGETIEVNTEPLKQDTIGGVRIADMNYQLKDPGEYEFEVKPVVKGVTKAVRVDSIKIICSTLQLGSDIKNLLVEGKESTSGKYLPYLSWKKIPTMYQALTVQLRKGESEDDYYYQTIEFAESSSAFDGYGLFLSESYASLNEDFSVRVRSPGYGWTGWSDYKALGLDNEYFDIVYSNENAYISNIEDFAALLNNLIMWKPLEIGFGEAQSVTKEENGEEVSYLRYELKLAVPYSFTTSERALYFSNTRLIYEEGEKLLLQQELADMLVAALDTYTETTFLYDVIIDPSDTEEYVYDFRFSIINWDVDREYESTAESPVLKLNSDQRIFGGDSIGLLLPIDSFKDEATVYTSNQLYFAALNSYKPIPTPGSPADKMYKIARRVLETIIKTGMTREEMTFAIYDYVTSSIVYDYELAALASSTDTPFSLYDAFYLEGVFKATFDENGEVDEILQGKAVCDGISKAISLLLSMCGIDNARQTGVVLTAELEDGVGHVWNLVSILGEYYVLDATWALQEINFLEEPYELTTRKYLLSKREDAYGERGEKIRWYGKFQNLANKSLLSGFKYVIGEAETGETYTKYIETEEQFNYLVLEYFTSQVSSERDEVYIEVMFDRSKSLSCFLFNLYLEKYPEEGSAGMSYDDYVDYHYYKNDILNKIESLIQGQNNIGIGYLSENSQNIMTFKIAYHE